MKAYTVHFAINTVIGTFIWMLLTVFLADGIDVLVYAFLTQLICSGIGAVFSIIWVGFTKSGENAYNFVRDYQA